MLWLYVFIFIISCFLLTFSGSWLVKALMRIARLLGWKEFIVAFIVMAFATSIPELFIGISSALRGIPELSFGNIVGENVVHFTLAIALATLILNKIEIESRIIRSSSVFAVVAAILPLLLISDGFLSRMDGLVLIGAFGFYLSWLFSKRERFSKIYDGSEVNLRKNILEDFKVFIKDIGVLVVGIVILLISSEGIIRSASYFAETFDLTLPLVGILIIGLGTALPETWFCISAAREKQSWLVLGNLMGCVAVTATFVLGIVALINPIEIIDFSPFAIARLFLVISAVFFLFFSRFNNKITKKEAIFLLGIYILFVIMEALMNLMK